MWTKATLLAISLITAGCREMLYVVDADGGGPASDIKCSTPDLAPPAARCKAAAGLAGDAITCVDFDQITTLTDQKLAGWDFTNPVSCPGWEIVNGKLQVKNFSSFDKNCSFIMPPLNLNDADKQKYQRVTLAIVQKVDLNEAQQKAQIMLGLDDPLQRLLDQTTGKQPTQRRLLEVTRASLPAAVNSTFQPLFKLTSSIGPGPGYLGWQIESIAVIGQP